jgi:hypothetical protein
VTSLATYDKQSVTGIIAFMEVRRFTHLVKAFPTTIDLKVTKTRWVRQRTYTNKNKQTPWLESAFELYRPSDRLLSTKLMPTLADRGCRVVKATNPQDR